MTMLTHFLQVQKKFDKYLKWSIFSSFFWYVSLFPGRLGFDNSELIRLIREGKSTNWWSAEYYWFIRIASFNGRQIYLPSFVCLAVLLFSIHQLLRNLELQEKLRNKIFFYCTLMPFISGFALGVSHDVFLASGLILLVSLNLKKFQIKTIEHKSLTRVEILSILLLLTSITGSMIILLYLFVSLIFDKRYKKFLIYLFIILSLHSLTEYYTENDQSNFKYFVFLADLKCIAQHPQADISIDQWKFLDSLAPMSEWTKPITCSIADRAYESLTTLKYKKIRFSSEFLVNYLKIVFKNPLIAIEAHLQRSRGALPPPLFEGPENQVSKNLNEPIGLNTNTALQSGPEIIHPSIDEKTVKLNLSILRPFEGIAQFFIYLINRTSWFWGWGGLWLYPIYFWSFVKWRKAMVFLRIFYPILSFNFLMVLISPSGVPRYFMSSVIVGFIFAQVILNNLYMKLKPKII